MKKLNVSVIVPLYKEEKVIVDFNAQLMEVLVKNKYNWEIIYVLDKSEDRTEIIIKELSEANSKVKFITFTNRIGHQKALMAGIINAKSQNFIVTMDGDLQHPPTLIPQMINYLQEGYQIAQTVRKKSVDKRFIVRFFSKSIYKGFMKLTGIKLTKGATDFRAISPSVAFYLRTNYLDKKPFLRGYISSLNLPTKYMNFNADQRKAGKSKFTLVSLAKLTLDGLLAFSTKPLILITFIGVVVSVITFISSVLILGLKWFGITKISGLTTLLFAILFLSGVQILSLGIIGLYLSQVLSGIQNRPMFIPEKSKNFRNLNSRI
jgi:glycosyltransferase involved in cell wall biosynthesis